MRALLQGLRRWRGHPLPDPDPNPAAAAPPAAEPLWAMDDDEKSPTYLWPDDPDEVPGWRLAAETAAEQNGYRLPGYRTKRDYWQHCDLAEMTCASTLTAPTVGQLEMLDHGESARRFLAAIRHDEMMGEYTAGALSDEYLEWCARSGYAPCPVDYVKSELSLLAGVFKRKDDTRDPDTGRRRRLMMWYIVPWAEMQAEEDHAVNIEDEFRLAA